MEPNLDQDEPQYIWLEARVQAYCISHMQLLPVVYTYHISYDASSTYKKYTYKEYGIILALSVWCSIVILHSPVATSQILTKLSALALASKFLYSNKRSVLKLMLTPHLNLKLNSLDLLFQARPRTESVWLPFLYLIDL